jgi:hypothetical protein
MEQLDHEGLDVYRLALDFFGADQRHPSKR